MKNGWQPMETAPLNREVVELWIERPGFDGRLSQGCHYSPRYGWLGETGRTIQNGDDTKIIAWRPTTKGPYHGD